MNMNVSIKEISPEQAAQLVDDHKNYRKINQTRIDLYAKAMSSGKWLLSIIIIDENGNLCDGEHRLRAVIKANKPVTFAIVNGWPVDSIVSIDNGMVRTRSQIATAERGVKNANKIMSLVFAMDNPYANSAILNVDALSIYDKNGKLAEEVFGHAAPPFCCAIHLAAFARAIMAMPENKSDILEALEKMSAIEFSEPRMSGLRLYYRWAVTQKVNRGGTSMRWEAYRRGARAILAYINGEEIDKLYCPNGDPFKDLIKQEVG